MPICITLLYLFKIHLLARFTILKVKISGNDIVIVRKPREELLFFDAVEGHVRREWWKIRPD